MKIVTPEFEALFVHYPLYSQQGKADQLVIAVLRDPAGFPNWYLIEYNAESKTAFGYLERKHRFVSGYFSLIELEFGEQPDGNGIEQDPFFEPMSLSHIGSLVEGGSYV